MKMCIDKNIPDFWKVWNKKFERSCNTKINGLDDIRCITDERDIMAM